MSSLRRCESPQVKQILARGAGAHDADAGVRGRTKQQVPQFVRHYIAEVAREVNVKGYCGLRDLFWAADGRGLFITPCAGTATTLLYVDLEGRAQVIWQQKLGTEFGIRARGVPSPNGRHLALLDWSIDTNVWLLENF